MLNEILSNWPSVFGGAILRSSIWGVRLGHCGKGVRFGDRIKILGFRSISISKNCSFMSNSFLYAVDDGAIVIGENCSFNHNVHIDASSGRIIIGKDVLFGPNVVLRSSNHVFSNPNIPIRMQGHQRGEIVIGSDVWLGAGVIITPDVSIGSGCIVGAGSVVTNNLPDMTICVGNPARVLRSR